MSELSSLLFVETDELGRPTGLIASNEDDTISSSILPSAVNDAVSSVAQLEPLVPIAPVLSTLPDDFNDLSGDVTSLSSDVAGFQEDVDDLSSLVPIAPILSALPDDFNDLSGDVTSLSSDVAGFQSDIDSISALTGPGVVDDLLGLSSDVTSLSGDVTSLSTTVGSFQGQIDAVDGRVTDVSGEFETVSSFVFDGSNVLSDLSGQHNSRRISEGLSALDNFLTLVNAGGFEVLNAPEYVSLGDVGLSGGGLEIKSDEILLRSTNNFIKVQGNKSNPTTVSIDRFDDLNNVATSAPLWDASREVVEDGSGVLSGLSGTIDGFGGGPDVPTFSALETIAKKVRVIQESTGQDSSSGDVIQLSGAARINGPRNIVTTLAYVDSNGDDKAVVKLQDDIGYISANKVGLVGFEDIKIGSTAPEALTGTKSIKNLYDDVNDASTTWNDASGVSGVSGVVSSVVSSVDNDTIFFTNKDFKLGGQKSIENATGSSKLTLGNTVLTLENTDTGITLSAPFYAFRDSVGSTTLNRTQVERAKGAGTYVFDASDTIDDVSGYVFDTSAELSAFIDTSGELALLDEVSENQIAPSAVTASRIDQDAIRSDKIVSQAIIERTIDNAAVTQDKIADEAVINAKIKDGAVGVGKISSGAVDTSNIAISSVNEDRIADNSISVNKIKDGNVTASKIAASAVETDAIKPNAVTNDQLASNSVDTSNIVNDAIGPAQLSDTGVTPSAYDNANIIVDAQGRITSATNGTGGGGNGDASAILVGPVGQGTYAPIGDAAPGNNNILVYKSGDQEFRYELKPFIQAGAASQFDPPNEGITYNFGASAGTKVEFATASGAFTTSGPTKTLLEFDGLSRVGLGFNSVPLEISALGESNVRLRSDNTNGAFVLVEGTDAAPSLVHLKNTDLSADADSQIDFDTDINMGGSTHLVGNMIGANHIACQNKHGSTLTAGTPVYIKGFVGSGAAGKIEIGAASASVASAMPAIGVLSEDLDNNIEGYVDAFGVADNIDTQTPGFALQDTLYVAPTGGLTNVRPTATSDLVQNIGIVERVDSSNGKIIVLGPGRTNDIPNSPTKLLSTNYTGTGNVPTSLTTVDWASPTLNNGSITYSAGEFTIPAAMAGDYLEFNIQLGTDTGITPGRIKLEMELQKDTGSGYTTEAAAADYVVRNDSIDRGSISISGYIDPAAVSSGDKYRVQVLQVAEGNAGQFWPDACKISIKSHRP